MCQFSKLPEGYCLDLRAYNEAQIRAMHSAFTKYLAAEKWHGLNPPGLEISDREAEQFYFQGVEGEPAPVECFADECRVDFLVKIDPD